MIIELIIGEKTSFVRKIPATYRKEVEIPFTSGYLYKNGICVGKYRYIENGSDELIRVENIVS